MPFAFCTVLGLLLIAVIWVGIRGAIAEWHIEKARTLASQIEPELINAPSIASSTVDELADNTEEARLLTSDPVWRAFEILPWVGPQLRAASTLALSLDDVVDDSVTPLLGQLGGLDPSSLAPSSGAIDLAPLVEARDVSAQAATRARDAADRAAAIDTAPLLGALRGPVEQGVAQLDELAGALEALRNATVLVPAMLGADGPRDYLLMFQNNAEWRSLGGIAGTFAVLHTDGGRIQLGAQASSTAFENRAEPIVPLDPEILAVFGDHPGRWVQNTTEIADFRAGAPLAAEFWKAAGGGDVDGVISLDPVALSYLLNATGPVTLPSGPTLTADNAVPMLLNDSYRTITDPVAQDVFFSEATVAIFDALTNGSPDPGALLQGLGRAGSENRLLLWSAHEEEQAVLDGSTLQGTLPASDAESTPIGVYVNDSTGSKLSYYMSLGTTAQWCNATQSGNTATASVRVELQSGIPDELASLPDYMLARDPQNPGQNVGGTPIGVQRTITYVYLPEGAQYAGSQASTGEATFVGTHEGRQVISWWSDTPPGSTATLDVSLTAKRTADIRTVTTPTYRYHEIARVDNSCVLPQ